MRTPFNPKAGAIIVRAEMVGPQGRFAAHLLVDTGATMSIINLKSLADLGYDPKRPEEWVTIGTASDIHDVGVFKLKQLTALGVSMKPMPVIGKQIPPGLEVFGMIGLDFFVDRKLTIDFTEGWIELD